MNKFPKSLLRFNKHLILNKRIDNIFYSTKPAVKPNEQENLQEKIKQTERVAHLYSRKQRIKKPQKPPFAKNLLLGNFDFDILTYPQLEKDELETLENSLQPVANFFKSPETAEIKTLTNEFVQDLNNLCLFGLRVPISAGGRELSHTETCKFHEIFSSHALGKNLIYNDLFGIQAILKNGSKTLKTKYLPRLVSGQSFSAFCVSEKESYDPKAIKTRAVRNPDGSWTLNGQKSWVINGSIADLFIVYAETDYSQKDDLRESLTTFFVVEKTFGGITTQKCNTLVDYDVSDVQFNNTPVPAENVLGEEILGLDVVSGILTETRLSTGAVCVTIMKELLQKFTEHCKNIYVQNMSIIEADSVLTEIGDLVATTYAIESVTYLTSQLMDQYENQDCEMEAAIVKVFSSEQTALSSLSALDFLGTSSIVNNHWLNKIHREALGQSFLTESNGTLKLLIGLLGVQHAGIGLKENVWKLRNPFLHPWESLKYLWYRRKQAEDNPSFTLNLGAYVHPSISEGIEILEYCVLRLQYATELLLIQSGAEVVNDHQNLKRLAECVIDIYTMTACIGRASRSYCIGLRNSELELMVAITFCVKAKQRVQENIFKITQGRFNTGDQSKKVVADTVARWNGYCLEHPLARNF